MYAKHDELERVVVIGDQGVGKSNIANRFINNTFSPWTSSKNDFFVGHKVLDVKNIKLALQVYEMGDESKRNIGQWGNVQGASAAIIVYSISDKKSYQNIPKYIKEVKSRLGDQVSIIVVGNKSDLEDHRQISSIEMDEAPDWLPEVVDCFECSAKDDLNITKIFETAAKAAPSIRKKISEQEEGTLKIAQAKLIIKNIHDYIENTVFPVKKFLMWGGEPIQLSNGWKKTVPSCVKKHWETISKINTNDDASYFAAIAEIQKDSKIALAKTDSNRAPLTTTYYQRTLEPQKHFSQKLESTGTRYSM